MKFGSSQKNFSYVLGSGIGVTALNSIFYFIFATFLEPDRYGELSYFIAIAGTASVISQFGFPFSITVFQSKKKFLLSNQINVLAVIISSVISFVLIFVDLYAALLSFSLSFFAMNQHNLLGLKKYKSYFWVGLIKGLIIISLPLGLYFVLEMQGIILGMAISNLVCSFFFLKNLKLKVQSFKELRSNLKFITHNFSVQASTGFAKFLDKLIIVPFFGFAFAGIYQFNLQILFALTLLPTSLHSFLLSEESSGKTHAKISYLVIFASIIAVVVINLAANDIIEYIFPKFSEGVQSLQIMIISLIPISFSAILNAKLQAKESTKIGFPAIARIGSLLILLPILGQLHGIMGLAASVVISSSIETIFLAIIFLSQKKQK